MNKPRRRAQSGFTLLELLVVIAIIGLLVGYGKDGRPGGTGDDADLSNH